MCARVTLICLASLFAVFTHSLAAQSGKGAHVPTPSTWRLDASKSDLAGAPAPQSDEITFLVDRPDLFSFKEEMVDSAGDATHVSWSGRPDGSLHPLEGTPGDQASFNADLTKVRVVMHDGSEGDFVDSLSGDQKEMKQVVEIHLTSGQKLRQKLIYVRIR